MASSSSSPQNHPPSSATRRVPPPCWSSDETVALIDCYRDKWYALRRGNLKAHHWEEVAEDVAARCPLAASKKTAVQCRHKMEKLRRRYREEVSRAAVTPDGRHRYSVWVHFKKMEEMEMGPEEEEEDDEEEEDGGDEESEEGFYPNSVKIRAPRSRILYGSSGKGNQGNGSRSRVPCRSNLVPDFDEFNTRSPDPDPKFGAGPQYVGKSKENDLGEELVEALKGLGDGFLRMEKMKMEMAKEIEAMRMEMELKRTRMILEFEERMVRSFVKVDPERKSKKVKRMSSAEEA